MECAEAREAFSARIDDALGADELARLERHVAGCAACAREWRELSRAVAFVREAGPVRAPAGFVDRVLARARPPWWRRWLAAIFVPLPRKLPVEAAAVVLVSVIGVLIYRQSPELQRATRTHPFVSQAPALDVASSRGAPPLPAAPASPPPQARTAEPARPPAAPPAAAPAAVPPEPARPKASRDESVAPATRERAGAPAPPAEGTLQAARGIEEAKAPRAQDAGQIAAADAARDLARAPELSKRLGGTAKSADPDEAMRESAARRDAAPGRSAAAPPAAALRPAAVPPASSAAPESPPADIQAARKADALQRTTSAPADARALLAPAVRQQGSETGAGSAAAPRIRAELRVAEPASVEEALRQIAARASGRLAGCTDDGSGARECLLFVPRSGYPLLVGALAGLGRFSETSRPDSVPDPVGVIVRVTR